MVLSGESLRAGLVDAISVVGLSVAFLVSVPPAIDATSRPPFSIWSASLVCPVIILWQCLLGVKNDMCTV